MSDNSNEIEMLIKQVKELDIAKQQQDLSQNQQQEGMIQQIEKMTDQINELQKNLQQHMELFKNCTQKKTSEVWTV